MIRFVLDGIVQSVTAFDPSKTLLEWLRENRRTGTKEGCAEGDCGACTVALGEMNGGEVRYRAVNSCIQLLPMINGKEIVTVESVGSSNDPHPIQSAMAEGHGTQCGFCTPGFIMSMFARYQDTDEALPNSVDDLLAGNLCRCTGYGPIRAAACAKIDISAKVRFGGVETREQLNSLMSSEIIESVYQDPVFESERKWFIPKTEAQLSTLLQTYPDATLVAGATDVGLWVTKQHRNLKVMVFINDIPSLNVIEQTTEGLNIGSGVTYSDAWSALEKMHTDLGELVRRIGSIQVRNSGTIGGNIANGSPIGDTMPALIALGAKLELNGPGGVRSIPLKDYFLAYGEQDLRENEYVKSIFIPRLKATQIYSVQKISKRFDQDISSLCGAFCLNVIDGKTKTARIAFGGMSATPKRAKKCEAVLVDQSWPPIESVLNAAVGALASDFKPISDMRASANYRLLVAQNLLRKLAYESREKGRSRIQPSRHIKTAEHT